MKHFFYIISGIGLISMFACTKNSSTLEDESTFEQKINRHTITTDSHHYHCDMSILYNITPPANI